MAHSIKNTSLFTLLLFAVSIMKADQLTPQEHLKQILNAAHQEASKMNINDWAYLVYNHPYLAVATTGFCLKLPAKLLLHQKHTANPLWIPTLFIYGLLAKTGAHAYLRNQNLSHSHDGFYLQYGSIFNTNSCSKPEEKNNSIQLSKIAADQQTSTNSTQDN
ncbi:hypothetical protein Noda2021_04930 [Candidatus Dependentiae bacterium Noda2021]|nr:hypothetical protein Noda2021_04930 [Candidatus Dependentiae bacterium Noda2021]